MADFFQRDERNADDERLVQLEKKIHWCMQMLIDNGFALDKFSNSIASPDDLPTTEVWEDAVEVKQELTK